MYYWIQDGKLRVYHHLWGFNVHRGRDSGLEDHDEAIAMKTMIIIFKLLGELKGNNPGEDRYGNGDPLIFPYAQWSREPPRRNPVVGIIIYAPVHGVEKNTSFSPRLIEGTIRSSLTLLSDDEDTLDDKPPHHGPATIRKPSSTPIASQSTSKRVRRNSLASSSESQVAEIDDTETIKSGDGDDDTLVDEDGSISGRRLRFSSVSTMRSVRSI
ncbi:hypothetical protein AAF712_006288 [Marasmius tenuissimus]|uniref:Uncharacterized protein n=1 Tax=Marasmius tenuissimus TaxID=585030 RepID=A0ABR2ZZC0_9AGAR